MEAAYEDVSFSEFLRKPTQVANRLETVSRIRLRRRDAADLVLTRDDDYEQDANVVNLFAVLLAELLTCGDSAIIRRSVKWALPWSRFLSDDAVNQMIEELSYAARAAVSLHDLRPVSVLLTRWRDAARATAGGRPASPRRDATPAR